MADHFFTREHHLLVNCQFHYAAQPIGLAVMTTMKLSYTYWTFGIAVVDAQYA